MRGCGSDTSGTTGMSCMDGSYLSQGTAQRARRRERAAYFGSNRRGAVACFGVPAGLRRHRHSLADAPLAAKGPPVVGVRFPVARRRRDHLSEGSRRRKAPHANARASCEVSNPRPPHDPHRTPHLPAHTPRARSRAPCFHHLSPLTPLILSGDARSRWSIWRVRKVRPQPRLGPRSPCQRPSRHRARRHAQHSCWACRRPYSARPRRAHALPLACARRHRVRESGGRGGPAHDARRARSTPAAA